MAKKSVCISKIAKKLTIGSVFDAESFSKLTGISSVSTPARIRNLIAKGFIDIAEDNRLVMNRKYVMSYVQQLAMIGAGKKNKANRGRKSVSSRSRSKKEPHSGLDLTRKIECEKILRGAGLL